MNRFLVTDDDGALDRQARRAERLACELDEAEVELARVSLADDVSAVAAAKLRRDSLDLMHFAATAEVARLRAEGEVEHERVVRVEQRQQASEKFNVNFKAAGLFAVRTLDNTISSKERLQAEALAASEYRSFEGLRRQAQANIRSGGTLRTLEQECARLLDELIAPRLEEVKQKRADARLKYDLTEEDIQEMYDKDAAEEEAHALALREQKAAAANAANRYLGL